MSMIAIEGTDAAGKATQSRMLLERLRGSGAEAVLYSFPRYDTAVGAIIRGILIDDISICVRTGPHDVEVRNVEIERKVLQSLMFTDRYAAAVDIHEHLRAGRFVVCDRWTGSAEAYGAADGLDPEWLSRVQRRLPSPLLTILLVVPEEEALRRRPKLQDRYERDRGKQQVVAGRYADFAKSRRGWATVDGVGTAEEVHERLWTVVSRRLLEEGRI